MKADYLLLLQILSQNEDQKAFANAKAINHLIKKKLMYRKSDNEATVTDKAIKKLKKQFDIKFREENNK